MIDTTDLYPSEILFQSYRNLFEEMPNPIFIPKKRKWASQRRKAKNRRNKH